MAPLLRAMTNREAEYCGAIEHREYQSYLAVENIDHSKTKARLPAGLWTFFGMTPIMKRPVRQSRISIKEKYSACLQLTSPRCATTGQSARSKSSTTYPCPI